MAIVLLGCCVFDLDWHLHLPLSFHWISSTIIIESIYPHTQPSTTILFNSSSSFLFPLFNCTLITSHTHTHYIPSFWCAMGGILHHNFSFAKIATLTFLLLTPLVSAFRINPAKTLGKSIHFCLILFLVVKASVWL